MDPTLLLLRLATVKCGPGRPIHGSLPTAKSIPRLRERLLPAGGPQFHADQLNDLPSPEVARVFPLLRVVPVLVDPQAGQPIGCGG